MILLSEKLEKISFDPESKCPSGNATKASWGMASAVGKKPGFFNKLITFEKDAVTDE